MENSKELNELLENLNKIAENEDEENQILAFDLMQGLNIFWQYLSEKAQKNLIWIFKKHFFKILNRAKVDKIDLHKVPKKRIKGIDCINDELLFVIPFEKRDSFEWIAKNKIKFFKIHDFENPAHALSFFKEHRYYVYKGERAKKELEKRKYAKDSDIIHKIVQGGKYELVVSNYENKYHYTTVKYRYFNEKKQGIDTKTSHLANTKINIIFASKKLMENEKIAYRSKEVENMLKSYPSNSRIKLAGAFLYFKKK